MVKLDMPYSVSDSSVEIVIEYIKYQKSHHHLKTPFSGVDSF